MKVLNPGRKSIPTNVVHHGKAILNSHSFLFADKNFCKILNTSERMVREMGLSSLYKTQDELDHFLMYLQRTTKEQKETFVTTSWCCHDSRTVEVVILASPMLLNNDDIWEIQAVNIKALHKTRHQKPNEEPHRCIQHRDGWQNSGL